MAVKSLAIDRNDQAGFWSGNPLEKPLSANMLFRAIPFFFTREGAELNLMGHYRGASAFVIASGPSLSGVDLVSLRSCWAMTLNNAHTTFRAQANCVVDDPSRFNLSLWLDPTIQKYVPMAHFDKPLWDNRLITGDDGSVQLWEKAAMKVGDCPNVVGFRRNEKFHAPRWLYEETVNWGNHAKYGGGRSVLLAALRILFLLGFRRVYLLGVDFEMSQEKKYHFTEERPPNAIRGNMRTYAKLQQWFTELQPHFLKENLVVKNCNPHSRLTAFPFITFEEAIAEATAHLGNYSQERTAGMYQPMSDKLAAIGMPASTNETTEKREAGASSEPAADANSPA